MTRVTITETYAVGCPDCVEALIRLCQWSGRDSQVIALNFKAVPRCDHALPIQKGKPERIPGTAILRMAKETPVQQPEPEQPPPPPAPTLFATAETRPTALAGSGYDEPQAG